MTGNSDSRIIIAQNFIETTIPSVLPFHPRPLISIVDEAIVGGYIKGHKSSTINYIFEATSLRALGVMLADDVDRYFKQTASNTDIPHISFSDTLDPNFTQKMDEKLYEIYHSLGDAEKAYVENTSNRISDMSQDSPSLALSYAFNLSVGQDYINVMTRLALSDLKDKNMYQQFMQDALPYKIAGHILQRAALSSEDGVVLNGRGGENLTWKNLCREIAPRIDLRYLSLKI